MLLLPKRLVLACICSAFTLCYVLTQPASSQSSIRALGTLLSHCTAEHGYSVAKGNVLSRFEIGAGELAWRRCVYDGIRVTVMPNAPYPDLYDALIKDDKALTAGVQAEQVTRQQRSEKNLAAIKHIQAREGAYQANRERELREQAKTEAAIRETQRILDLQERLLEIRRAALEGLR